MKIKYCTPVAAPGTKDEGRTKEGDESSMKVEQPLDRDNGMACRSIVAKANYMSPDGPDIAHLVREMARGMSGPTIRDWCRLKRLARYLKGKPRMIHRNRWQENVDKFSVHTDADWGGDEITRKSTAGG